MPQAERLSENEKLAEKRSFEDNCEIFILLCFICIDKLGKLGASFPISISSDFSVSDER